MKIQIRKRVVDRFGPTLVSEPVVQRSTKQSNQFWSNTPCEGYVLFVCGNGLPGIPTIVWGSPLHQFLAEVAWCCLINSGHQLSRQLAKRKGKHGTPACVSWHVLHARGTWKHACATAWGASMCGMRKLFLLVHVSIILPLPRYHMQKKCEACCYTS